MSHFPAGCKVFSDKVVDENALRIIFLLFVVQYLKFRESQLHSSVPTQYLIIITTLIPVGYPTPL